MLIPQPQPPRTHPQFHTRKHHSSYNGARHLPVEICIAPQTRRLPHLNEQWEDPYIESEPVEDLDEVYEIVLYYPNNRACTIYRTWEDFKRLQTSLPEMNPEVHLEEPCEGQIEMLQVWLGKVLRIDPSGIGVEYFLRRRWVDCGGRL